MRRLLKGFLIAAGAILALAAVGVLAINLYVQSVGTQKRIEHALSSGLKAPVHVTSTIVTPWSGLKASGITVPQPAPATGDFLEATSFTAHFDWMGLLKHRLDASDVSLDEPMVTWMQSPGGRWELPREAETTGTAGPAEPGAEKPKRAAGPVWAINVQKLMVNGACFDFWDQRGMRVLEFAGVGFDCANPRATGTRGHASSRSVSLLEKIFFRDMETDWSYARGTVKLTSFQTGVGGGELRGDAQVQTMAKHSPFNVDVNFGGVDVNQMMKDAGQPDGEVTGRLTGWIDLYGNPGKRSSMNGSGRLELAGGRMKIDFLQMLGQGLQIPGLLDLDLKTAEVDVRVVSGVVNVDTLVLASNDLQLTAKGAVQSDGKLALNARLTIDGAISGRLPSFILTYFKEGETADTRYLDFGIGNTLEHPKTNLLENLLGSRIQGQMTDLFKTIFGKKHKEETAAPPP